MTAAAGLSQSAVTPPEAFPVPTVWSPSALLESQQQLWEKMVTLNEMWWTLWMGTCSPAALLSTRGWDGQDSLSRAQASQPPAVPSAVEPLNIERPPRARRLRQG